jgi:hypothetical protein
MEVVFHSPNVRITIYIAIFDEPHGVLIIGFRRLLSLTNIREKLHSKLHDNLLASYLNGGKSGKTDEDPTPA